MMNRAIIWSLTLAIAVPILFAPVANADVTSPSIKDKGKKYTPEKPKKEYYGTSSSSRLVEASELRMTVESMIADGDWEPAIPKAKKAVQLDPADPSGHLFLARILTTKFYDTKGKVDEKLLGECINEWQIIRLHDVDPTEQWEAGQQVKKFQKIAKVLEKEKLREEQEKEKASSIARKTADPDDDDARTGKTAEKDQDDDTAAPPTKKTRGFLAMPSLFKKGSGQDL